MKIKWDGALFALVATASVVCLAARVQSPLAQTLTAESISSIRGGSCYIAGSQNCPNNAVSCVATHCTGEGAGATCPANTYQKEQIQPSFDDVAETPTDPGLSQQKNLSSINCTKKRTCSGCTWVVTDQGPNYWGCSSGSGNWSQEDSRTPTQPDPNSAACNVGS